eukprot:TRINITY_DN21508_c0_g1_i2.p1 TRINITY_DN21508_c0_g1~~TRINITY_DN21508_c0_g1_i2.p1  ORF type:complete len:365 (+),score=77.80 TRINITY_DN21508_c0_g1_i2:103-1197(+)
MGRKKKPSAAEESRKAEETKARREAYDSSDESDSSEEVRHYELDPEIQELACCFGIDTPLTQRLNDVMIGKRQRTWSQDLERLYEILKDAHVPSAMLNLKVKDMEKGNFVGKAKCEMKVKDLSHRHKLDKGASTKLLEAMGMREAMGKDIEKDLFLLDEHLSASNAPSKLISMKLESLRKGYNVGHCIYSREPAQGNQGPGAIGVFDSKRKRVMGYTDADLDIRFGNGMEGGHGSGNLMDEATVKRMMAAERKKHASKLEEEAKAGERSRSPSYGRKAKRSRSRSNKRTKKKAVSRSLSRSRSRSRRRKASCSRSNDRAMRREGRRRSASRSDCGRGRKHGSSQRSGKKSRSRSASRKRKEKRP